VFGDGSAFTNKDITLFDVSVGNLLGKTLPPSGWVPDTAPLALAVTETPIPGICGTCILLTESIANDGAAVANPVGMF